MGSSSANTRTGLHHGFLRRLKFPRPLEQRRLTSSPLKNTGFHLQYNNLSINFENTYIYDVDLQENTTDKQTRRERERRSHMCLRPTIGYRSNTQVQKRL